ncbi:MAG: hypothetical protein JO257_03065 [Deltaproteobacteria bacterium]|nr:hypothetical protein [Deltaproteobacteria bacterium]
MRALEVFPGIELVPVAAVPNAIAIRDAAPDQNRMLFDGFEVPTLLAGGRGVFFRDQSQVWVEADGFGVENGRATGGLIDIFSRPSDRYAYGYELTPMDASVSANAHGASLAVRGSFFEPTGVPLKLDTGSHDFSAQGRVDYRLSRRWSLTLSELGASNSNILFLRPVVTVRYRNGAWRAVIAGSTMYAHVSTYDTRAELRRDLGHALGLHSLEVRIGEDSQYSETSASTESHANEAVWAATTAALTRDIVFIGGVRADAFDSYLTVQPRGMLAVNARGTIVRLAAGAYRRPTDNATPQRATQLALSTENHAGPVLIASTAYYVDRERLLVPINGTTVDGEPDRRATGVATNVGIEVRAVLASGPWRARLGASVSHATRADTPTAASHAADYDLPAHLDVMASRAIGAWQLGARVQLRAGLPYTPVTGSIYNVEADRFDPIDGKVMSARAPWRRELDLRVDRKLLPQLRAYLDVAIDGGVLGYTYNYDYSRRLDIHALPVLPWLGLVGTL